MSTFDLVKPALAIALGVSTLLTGCQDRTLGVSVSGYNHMPDSSWGIASFSVNGASGPNLSPESGGGGFNCCIAIPKHWQPGMKARVEWTYSTRPGGPSYPVPPPQAAEVDIPDYSAGGPATVDVHFYPDHRVKVVISNFGIEHPRYPMSEEDKRPWATDLTLLNHSSMHDDKP